MRLACLRSNRSQVRILPGSSTILTSNRAVDEWMAVFDEPLLGQSALDRFCHRAHQFVIEGESYRKRTAPGSASAPKTGRPATT
ncbi:MAG: ATP-binding protein [Acidobacteriia bacterium]|nr:ATP-binding protein [Terriglobia bacterium]